MPDSNEDSQWSAKLEDFARLQQDLDRKTGSITGLQLFTLLVTFAILVVFLGLVGQLFLGSPYGVIVASVLTSLALIGINNGMKNNNLRNLLEMQKEGRQELMDEHIPEPSEHSNDDSS